MISGVHTRPKTKLHAVTDAKGRPIRFFRSEGQVNDDSGVETPPGRLPDAEWLIADRNCDAEWFREILKDGRQKPCISGQKSCGKVVRHDKRRYRIEMMFGRPKGSVPHCNPL